MNNYVFKWLLHLTVEERLAFLKKIKPPGGLKNSWYKVISITIDRINMEEVALKSFVSEGEEEKKWTILRAEIGKAVYGKKDKNASIKVTKVFTEKKEELDDFIIKCELKRDKLLKHQLLFKAAERRNFSDTYFRELEIREELNQEKTEKTTAYLFEQYQIEYLRFFRSDVEKNKFKSTIQEVSYEPVKALQNIWKHLQILGLTMKIRMACQLKFWEKGKTDIVLKGYNDTEILYIKTNIKSYTKEEASAAHFYLELFEFLYSGDLNSYYQIKNTFIKQIKLFSLEEQTSICILLSNHLVYLVGSEKENRAASYIAYLDLSKFALTHIFSAYNYVSHDLFINFFTTAVKNDKQFIKDLLTEHIKIVPPKYSKIVKQVCQIFALFDLKGVQNYQAAKVIINNVSSTDPAFIMRVRVFEIMIEYELQLLDIKNEDNYKTTLLAENFKRSINDTDGLYKLWKTNMKEMNLNFLNAVIAIDTYNKEKALEIIEKAGNNINSKSWLLAKVKNL